MNVKTKEKPVKKSTRTPGKASQQDARATLMSSSETFAGTLGNVTWLMSMSADHKTKPVSHLENVVFPALLTKQFKLYFKGKQPVAFIAYALVSDEVRDKWLKDKQPPDIADWRTGKNVIIVEAVTPFSDRKSVIDEFIASVPKDELTV